MPSIGRARRYECSLTTEELIDEGKYVLNEYREGKEASLDPKYSGIIKDRKIRGHLRCGPLNIQRGVQMRDPRPKKHTITFLIELPSYLPQWS